MEDPATVGDVMNRTYVAVSEGDSVAGTADVMRREGVEGALVVRGRDPVGILRATDIVDLVAAGEDPDATTVGDVMVGPPPSIAPHRPFEDAVNAFVGSDTRWVVVVETDEVVGMLSPRDLVTASALLSGTDAAREEPGPAASELRSPDEAGDVIQSVCEVCGSLSRSLMDVNGQLVCADCRDI